MEYKVECDLEHFDAWSGGKDTLDVLKEKGVCSEVQYFIEELFCDEIPTETAINDVLWFERDFIAQHLGYKDWEEFEYGDEDEDEPEIYEDINGVKLDVGDEVVWHDEAGYGAGYGEDGFMIRFTIVEERGDGFFNLCSRDDDEKPERWAYYTELEIV